jgi:hypothetical protein
MARDEVSHPYKGIKRDMENYVYFNLYAYIFGRQNFLNCMVISIARI